MSIDYALLNWTDDVLPPKDEEGEFQSPSMGTPAELRDKIRQVWEEVDWSDPSYGTYDYEDHLLELPLLASEDEPVTRLTVFTHGDDALVAIYELCRKWNWSAVDLQTGQLVDFDQELEEIEVDEYE